MIKMPEYIRYSLVSRFIFIVGITLLVSVSFWAYFNVRGQRKRDMNNILAGTDKLAGTIKLGTHHAMMLNSRDDINQIINNVARQPGIENVRIYNKSGQIKFTSRESEVDRRTNIRAEACEACHRRDPPAERLDLSDRVRIFRSPEGGKMLGIIDPIYNEPGCSSDACHVHPSDKKVLGALDVVVSLERTEQEIRAAERGILVFAGSFFLVTATMIFVFVLRFVNRPIKKLINGTRRVAAGRYDSEIDLGGDYELGQLATAINQMTREIGKKQAELNEQRDEYLALFDMAPCMITVQDRNYKLLRFNRAFADNFRPKPGDACYHAYKGRDKKCPNCPVEKTFRDGRSHYGEESGVDKDGEVRHWIFITAPLKNTAGDVVAAMEMSLDITPRRRLEEELEASEAKYYAIFNNIPNPVFVLEMDSLMVIDCNRNVASVYGFQRDEVVGRPVADLFTDWDAEDCLARIENGGVLQQVRHSGKDGRTMFVDIWISQSEFSGKKVYLLTTSDITKRLEAEQQLMQAGKLATLGEMSTGVAHELNQPLSVIKTAGSFMIKKIRQGEKIPGELLSGMLEKMDRNVDRAAKIITHMRQFARKTEINLEKVQANQVMDRALEIFRQQLRARGIEIACDMEKGLPEVKADPDRLEQVFINLLINARDAIEERWERRGGRDDQDRISITTRSRKGKVFIAVEDTGVGIPKTMADKIFDPFFTTKEVGKGTGLGLSISYGIVKECRGSIRVKSEEGGGACFMIEFPAAGQRWEENE